MMFKGVISPVITVLNDKEKIDYDGNEKVINNLINNGINGLLFLGSMGEFFAFTIEEKKAFAEFAVKTVNKRIPVLIGTGGTVISEVVELTKFSENIGADGVVVISPYYFKLDDESIYRYYSTVAKSTKLPVIIYNFPDRTSVNLSPDLILRIARNNDNIKGIKDTVDNISHTRGLIQKVKPAIKDFSVFSGFDEYLIPNLMAGGDGVICGLTNVVPQLFSEIYRAYHENNFEKVALYQKKISILMNIYDVSQPFVGAIKTAASIMGLNINTMVKAPASKLSDSQVDAIREILNVANAL